MKGQSMENLDVKIHDAFTAWKKIDKIDVMILEGLSRLGPRNLALIAKHLDMPTSTVRYRVRRMLEDSILFFHLNPFHTNMGLKKAVIFLEAAFGYEDVLLDCLKVNDFWLFLCRIYGPYEGCGGIWTIPKGMDKDFEAFLKNLLDVGIAKSVEVNWTTCHEGIPVSDKWFNPDENVWAFKWGEWIEEVKDIEGKLPWTLREPADWPLKVDYDDLLIIKELEKDGRKTFTEISKTIGLPFERVKYHFREHVLKRGLIEGYQVDIYRFPHPLNEPVFFKFEFDSYDKMRKFALSLHDKPFPTFIGKILGENALVAHINLPKWEFRKFIAVLSTLIRGDLLKSYHYFIRDMFQTWRQTIPYSHFENGNWKYDLNKQQEDLKKVLEQNGFPI